jgi:hypothetical protein
MNGASEPTVSKIFVRNPSTWTRLLALIPLLLNTAAAMAETRIEKVNYRGWPNSYRISNGSIELVATSDVGPRIISLGFAGGRNLFRVFESSAGQTGGGKWTVYGGHRLWHSPEDRLRTYELDNDEVAVEEITNGLLLRQKIEPKARTQKTLEVTMDPGRAQVRVVHRLKNLNLWPVELAAWALSVMEGGGFAIVPLPMRHHADYLLPNRTIALWPYTDMRDERYLWGKDFILLKQVDGKNPTKVGVYDDEEWVAYYLKPDLFVKRFHFSADAAYPDFDSTVEVYTNSGMLELETVGPLRRLAPGAELTHEERWELHGGLDLSFTEEDVRAKLLPLVR